MTDPAAKTKSIGLHADARVVMVFSSPSGQFYRDVTHPFSSSGHTYHDKEILPTYRDCAKTHANPDTDGNSYHWFRKHPNLIKDIEIKRAEQVWVSDITYIKTTEGFMYLSHITDAYSKKVVGHKLSDNLKSINCICALKMTIKNRKYPERSLRHHSDRGLQYCCPDYTDTLESNHIDISMTTKHDPYENAVAERINGTLKNEFDLGDRIPDQKHTEREINKAIWIYNNLRPHENCNYLTPLQTHTNESIKQKKWPMRFKK